MVTFQWNSIVPGDAPDVPVTTPTRRCWRCQDRFPCDVTDVPAGAPSWWLCDACQEKLLPER